MVPTFTNLTATQNTTDAASFVTASITPTANRILFAFIANDHGSSATLPTLSGGGVSSWTQHATVLTNDSQFRLTVFRALTGASPTSGAITVDFAGTTQTGAAWVIIEASDTILTGTNGADAVAQSKTNQQASTGTTASVTFDGAWAHADNQALAGFVLDGGRAITPGTNFASVASVVLSSPSGTLATVSGRDSDLVVDISWTTNTRRSGIALEVVGATAGAGPAATVIPRLSRHGFNQLGS
jgi:hypothetical protein